MSIGSDLVNSAGSLRHRLTIGILIYTVLLTFAVGAHGYFVNERAERLIWESMLESEMQHFSERSARDPHYRWTDTDTLKLYGGPTGKRLPAEFDSLPNGVHDELQTPRGEYVVLLRDTEVGRVALALDIVGMEQDEKDLTWTIAASSLALIALLVLATFFGADRLALPLTMIVRSISALSPARSEQRVTVASSAPSEAIAIVDVLNDYLSRMDRFVEREREFINMASHELRTPIAVISGATEVALDRQSESASEPQLRHILRTARDMEHLVALLLTLAKDPERLQGASEQIDVAQLVPSIIEDHRFLAQPKELRMELRTVCSTEVHAPRQVVQAAISNLLRNAIENSSRGTILISTSDTSVVIEDPGQGMSPEEASLLYTKMARSGQTSGAGIGLSLISRLCERLRWQLSISPNNTRGTIAELNFHPLVHTPAT